MQRIPISRAVRATRIAISPRFAMRSRRNIRSPSQRYIAVLLRRPGLSLRAEDGEGVDHAGPGLRRLDDVIEVAHPRGNVRVREPIPIFAHELLLPALGILRVLNLLLEDDLDRAFRTHDRQLGGWPGEVEVPPDVLRTHDVIRAAVRFPRDHGDLRDGGLAESKQELRPVPDDPAVLLFHPRKETGYVDEGEERDVEAVAEPDEASRLGRRVDVQGSGEDLRLVPDNADGSALQAGEADHDVLRPIGVDLEPRVAGHDPADHVPHVGRLVGVLPDDSGELRIPPAWFVVTPGDPRIVHGILWPVD